MYLEGQDLVLRIANSTRSFLAVATRFIPIVQMQYAEVTIQSGHSVKIRLSADPKLSVHVQDVESTCESHLTFDCNFGICLIYQGIMYLSNGYSDCVFFLFRAAIKVL